jgi:hypothetical protein
MHERSAHDSPVDLQRSRAVEPRRAFAFSVFASGEGKAVVDGPNYLDMSRFGLLAVEENEVVG